MALKSLKSTGKYDFTPALNLSSAYVYLCVTRSSLAGYFDSYTPLYRCWCWRVILGRRGMIVLLLLLEPLFLFKELFVYHPSTLHTLYTLFSGLISCCFNPIAFVVRFAYTMPLGRYEG